MLYPATHFLSSTSQVEWVYFTVVLYNWAHIQSRYSESVQHQMYKYARNASNILFTLYYMRKELSRLRQVVRNTK